MVVEEVLICVLECLGVELVAVAVAAACFHSGEGVVVF